MNRAELVREVSRQSKITQRQCNDFLTALKCVLVDTLQKGEMISLAGFGKFYTKVSNKKQVFSPITQVKHTLEPQILVKFRVSPALKGQILG